MYFIHFEGYFEGPGMTGYAMVYITIRIDVRLPDVVVVFLQIYDGPAGVIRLARIRRLLRLGRFIQILRRRLGDLKTEKC